MVTDPPVPIPAGGAGSGLARRGSETASASSAVSPEDAVSRAESTSPVRLIVKVTEAVPAPAPGGKRLWRLSCAMRSTFQKAGESAGALEIPAEGAAAAFA